MRLCKLFDKYRDEELNAAGRSVFESHLADCEDCRTRISLLDNVVHLMRAEEVRPLDIADRIARKAFRRETSWDAQVISWLRPGPAVAALVIVLVLFSSLWMISGNGRVSAYSEYQKLINEADAMNAGSRVSQLRSDSELIYWLEQEGNSQ